MSKSKIICYTFFEETVQFIIIFWKNADKKCNPFTHKHFYLGLFYIRILSSVQTNLKLKISFVKKTLGVIPLDNFFYKKY